MADSAAIDSRRKRGVRRTTTLQVTGIFVVIIALLLGLLLVSLFEERSRNVALNHLDTQLLPASADVFALSKDYVDEETGERGFILAGEKSFLNPYYAGERDSKAQVTALRSDLHADRTAVDELTSVVAAHKKWDEDLATPEILLRARGPESPTISKAAAIVGKDLFDPVRSRLKVLNTRVLADVRDQSNIVSSDDSTLQGLVLGAFGGTAILGLGALLVIRRRVTRPLEALVHSIEDFDEKAVRQPVPIAGTGDLRQLGTAIEDMRSRLNSEAASILQRQQVVAAEDMRTRIAADIHDDSAQALTVVSLRLQRLAQKVDDPSMAQMLAEVHESVVHAMTRLRRLIFELQPPELSGDDGLTTALRDYVEETMDTQVECAVTALGDITRADLVSRTLAYRGAKEAILNTAKHSNATRLDVTVGMRDGGLHVIVKDNGDGFDSDNPPPPSRGHLGLSSTEGLFAVAGGWCHVRSQPALGCTAEFWLPARIGGAVPV